MKNLLRRIKLLFRKPKAGEIWALDSKSGTTKFIVNEVYEAYGDYCVSLTLLGISHSWEGPIKYAGPIYIIKDNNPKWSTLKEAILYVHTQPENDV